MYYGCLKEKKDIRDYKLAVSSTNYAKQYKIDMPEVKDQGIVNSCVAFVLSTFLEELYKYENKKFSTGFIYGYRPLGYFQSEGMYPREALKTLKNIGDVEYKDFTYNREMTEIMDLVENNIVKLKALASNYKIESYARIYTESEIKNVLSHDVPVPISIPVRGNLELDDRNTILITDKDVTGYHMLIIYGWCDEGWLIQNSWGKDWGINGTAILPYDYDIDSAWAISTKDNSINTKQSIWQKIYRSLTKIFNFIDSIFEM